MPKHNAGVRLTIAAAAFVAAAAFYVTVRKPGNAKPVMPAAAPPGPAQTGLPDNLSQGLLEQMQHPEPAHGSAASQQVVRTSQQLEGAYAIVERLQQQIDGLKAEAAAASQAGNADLAAQKMAVVQGELSVLNEKLLSLETDLQTSRAARPNDPAVQWLSGELLMLVGGEPEQILPYFERAVSGGLQRPDVLMGLSRVQLEANQFQAAYETSLKALELDPRNPRVWEMFGGMAAANNRFDEVLTRIDRVYPQAGQAWASALRTRAQALQDAWAREQQTRLAERAADNLPRVRLTIEHQSFRQAGDGGRASSLQTTGRDDVELELFEDQAPATVANFLVLVERGFYNGTRFHWVEAGGMAVGGDANTKNADPDDDGIGGPGYVIPDEFRKPGARLHFRGSVAMVESAAHTAGSQFFIELVPHPEMNHHLTVFGRVVKGQDGVDRITSGRTNLHFGKFGKPIPGDVIVRAEVIRKRPHTYRVIKDRSKVDGP